MRKFEFEGNLLDSSAQVIMHQVNCQVVMGSGVAKAIREKWPLVFEKYEKCVNGNLPQNLLGKVQAVKVSDTQTVFNLFGQENYGYDGKRYTSYDAIDSCLQKAANYCKENKISSIALPYHMACDRGGANWDVVMAMLRQHFNDLEITVEIWKL